jgi:hypothetical protein
MLDEFENVVASIMAVTKCDRAKAEATARLNGHTPSIAIDEQKRDDVLEKAEQWEVAKLFIAFGFKVDNLSQARRTKQAPGLPDLWCMHRELAIAFWWETKRQVGGKLSDAQIDFRDDCARCHVGYGAGDRHAARTHLIKLGLARIVGDVIEPIRNEALLCQ